MAEVHGWRANGPGSRNVGGIVAALFGRNRRGRLDGGVFSDVLWARPLAASPVLRMILMKVPSRREILQSAQGEERCRIPRPAGRLSRLNDFVACGSTWTMWWSDPGVFAVERILEGAVTSRTDNPPDGSSRTARRSRGGCASALVSPPCRRRCRERPPVLGVRPTRSSSNIAELRRG